MRMLSSLETPLPPILVHWPSMRVIDGRHRLRAAELRGYEVIEARFVECEEDQIFAAAVRANIEHGLPLSLAEREAAAARIVVTHPHWSDRLIALTAGLSNKTVAAIRARATGENPRLQARQGRDGRIRPVSTAEGRMAAASLIEQDPAMSLRQVAKAVGLSVGTVRDVRVRLANGHNPVPSARHPAAGRERDTAMAAPRKGNGLPQASRPATLPNDASAILQSLCKDPALRHNDTGRLLLRLLHTCTACLEKLEQLAMQAPPHRTATIARLADVNAIAWSNLAKRLEHESQLTNISV